MVGVAQPAVAAAATRTLPGQRWYSNCKPAVLADDPAEVALKVPRPNLVFAPKDKPSEIVRGGTFRGLVALLTHHAVIGMRMRARRLR